MEAPKGTPVEYLVQLLEEKWDWIQTTRKEMAERAHECTGKGLIKERFLYLGIRMYRFQDASIEQDNAILKDKLHIYVKELKDEKIQQALKRFYYKQCL